MQVEDVGEIKAGLHAHSRREPTHTYLCICIVNTADLSFITIRCCFCTTVPPSELASTRSYLFSLRGPGQPLDTLYSTVTNSTVLQSTEYRTFNPLFYLQYIHTYIGTTYTQATVSFPPSLPPTSDLLHNSVPFVIVSIPPANTCALLTYPCPPLSQPVVLGVATIE